MVNGRYIDFTNKRVGDLTILERIEDHLTSKHDKIQWRAQCDCGNIVTVSSRQLRRTPNRSCGCKRKVHSPLYQRDPRDTNINRYFSSYKSSARKRKIKWNLSRAEFCKLIFSNCHYCNKPPCKTENVFNSARYKRVKSKEAKARQARGVIQVSGIDRIENDGSYSSKNCVPCCKDCNYGKYTKTTKEFLDWIKAVYEHSIR